MESKDQKKLHIAMFPWLAYGHLVPFLEVSKFLAQKGHQISFISTPKNINRIRSSSFSPLIDFVELPLPAVDGLPESAESTSELPINKVPYLKKAYDLLKPSVTQFIQHSGVNWIVHDFSSYWMPRVATQFRVNSVYFSIFSANSLAFFGPPSELLGNKRRRPEDFTVVPEWVNYPSNGAFKLHEMVSHWDCMDDEVSDFHRVAGSIQDCNFVTMRSCTEFESDAVSLLRKIYGKPVVPLGLLPPGSVPQQQGVADDRGDETWGVLRGWLENKKPNSVVYIAFGTEVTPSQELMHELADGIEKSGLPFIWVVNNRPLVEGVLGADIIPPGFQTRVDDRGLVWRGWAPQLRILGHASVGGFLTHCGWSSVVEALRFGRVLILFSGAYSDQPLNARLMQDKRVGLEIPRDERDGSFTSDSVAELIRRVMVEKEGESIRSNAWAMKEIFGNVELNNRCLDEFTRTLETWPTST
ncbi:UDP-glycosyltransferase 91C1-like [Pyrus x bretschneideri]|uniref:UDP-glycosyltransferase 91C1-like n=1 Tax=Pyrus x bretschneideri TaxID=225117 RepID=UPI002030BBCB|nr:UDP-glycosyltransferase 91C1-like [Pyrus x bretschneideri]